MNQKKCTGGPCYVCVRNRGRKIRIAYNEKTKNDYELEKRFLKKGKYSIADTKKSQIKRPYVSRSIFMAFISEFSSYIIVFSYYEILKY
jgi:hypothetical protein